MPVPTPVVTRVVIHSLPRDSEKARLGRMLPVLIVWLGCTVEPSLTAGDLVLELTQGDNVNWVAAVDRWDADGNPRRAVDARAKIEAPQVDAVARLGRAGRWTFADLAPGRYDLVLLLRDRIRIEGFGYPPVLEFDPFVVHVDRPPGSACDWIKEDIGRAKLYENKVSPLHFAGNETQIRVLMQLLRDQPTSYDSQFGEPVATLRHELWQYDHRYGAWSKTKRTRVFDRVLLAKRELATWTWIWEPELGDIVVGDENQSVRYTVPREITPDQQAGLIRADQ